MRRVAIVAKKDTCYTTEFTPMARGESLDVDGPGERGW
jgi:hypothetical protein